MKHISVQHPLVFYGIPGLVSLAAGMVFGAWAFDIYDTQGTLVTNIALISIFWFIAGLTLLTTGVILFTMVSIVRER